MRNNKKDKSSLSLNNPKNSPSLYLFKKIASNQCICSKDWWDLWIVGRDITKTKSPKQWNYCIQGRFLSHFTVHLSDIYLDILTYDDQMLHNQSQRNWYGTCPTLAYGRASFKIHSWMQLSHLPLHVLSVSITKPNRTLTVWFAVHSSTKFILGRPIFFLRASVKMQEYSKILFKKQSRCNIITKKSSDTQLLIVKLKNQNMLLWHIQSRTIQRSKIFWVTNI